MSDDPNAQNNGSGAHERVPLGIPDVYVDKGSHIAHFFRGDDERLTILVPFIRVGLAAGDQCVIVSEPSVFPVIRSRLEESHVDVESALESGHLVVYGGSSEVADMASTFEDVISTARRAGRDTIRIGGDMTWALGKMPTPEKLLEWEAFYDNHVGPQSNFVALCQYDHIRFGGSAIMYALQTHPLSIIGSIVQENPFYRDPAEVLQELSPVR